MARRKTRRRREGGLRLTAARRACARPTQTQDAYQAIYNYAADAGSQNFFTSDTWRAALLGTAAAGALFFGYARSARADCVGSGSTLTCTGDVNGGINVPGGYTTLDVNNLNADIAPESDDGIYFNGDGDVNINSNTTDPDSHLISVEGEGADGIDARSETKITIDHTGDITSKDGHGIYAVSFG